ncbi:hypothetical protein AAFF_G00104990 [Aldrovandia affinis]|uniref:Uncharacterized protein n=1 Tax=Aldrovandia affinis TaxID=143900 RepID=A0AAD7WXK8_9TELE|nr:hypothetical protein AAFF_G00104990 [Aldrovandia affinis]
MQQRAPLKYFRCLGTSLRPSGGPGSCLSKWPFIPSRTGGSRWPRTGPAPLLSGGSGACMRGADRGLGTAGPVRNRLSCVAPSPWPQSPVCHGQPLSG